MGLEPVEPSVAAAVLSKIEPPKIERLKIERLKIERPTPTDIAGIMALVGENQEHASALRQEFTFHQKQLLRMNRGNGKDGARGAARVRYHPRDARRDERTDRTSKGAYEYKGKYVTYDRPGYNYKDMDIDGELIDDLSNDMTDDKHSRDGIACDLFPLTADQQHKYNSNSAAPKSTAAARSTASPSSPSRTRISTRPPGKAKR